MKTITPPNLFKRQFNFGFSLIGLFLLGHISGCNMEQFQLANEVTPALNKTKMPNTVTLTEAQAKREGLRKNTIIIGNLSERFKSSSKKGKTI